MEWPEIVQPAILTSTNKLFSQQRSPYTRQALTISSSMHQHQSGFLEILHKLRHIGSLDTEGKKVYQSVYLRLSLQHVSISYTNIDMWG